MADSTPTEAEWAWIAGLFEGEGCITFAATHQVKLSLHMTDHDVVETLHRLVPGGGRFEPRKRDNPNWKDAWVWRLCVREDVKMFLEAILPWLHSRRATRARAALERLENCRGAQKLRTHCPQGHAYDEANTRYVPRKGGGVGRSCRICSNESLRRCRKRKRDALDAL